MCGYLLIPAPRTKLSCVAEFHEHTVAGSRSFKQYTRVQSQNEGSDQACALATIAGFRQLVMTKLKKKDRSDWDT